MRDTFLPFAKPSLGEEEIPELVDSLRSGWITTGPKTEKFTAEFREYVGGTPREPRSRRRPPACTSALLAHGVGPGDEVITTPMTFAATLNRSSQLRRDARCSPTSTGDTLNMRVEKIEKKITPRTKAIIPVHYVGQPCDLDPHPRPRAPHGSP